MMVHFSELLTRSVQPSRFRHCANCKQHTRGAVLVSVGSDYESVVIVAGDVDDFFSGIDSQIMVENKMNVVRQEFLARWFFPHGLQRAFMHLHFIGSRKHGAAYGILPNRIGNCALFDYEIGETFAVRSLSRRKSCRSGTNDYQVKGFVHNGNGLRALVLSV